MKPRAWSLCVAVFAMFAALLSPLAAGAAQTDVDRVIGGAGGDVVASTTGSYIVVMEDAPLVVTEGRGNLNTSKAKNKGKAIARGHDRVLEDVGVGADSKVQSFTNALNGFSALMSLEQAQAVANTKGVAQVLPDEMRYIDTDSSTAFLELSAPAGAWQTGRTGEGVIIGVIDTGIWPEHPSFADDGSYDDPGLDIECDFGNTAHNAADAPFTCNNKLIGARQTMATYRSLIGADPDEYDSARDDDGHGTHTASTAGGNAGVEAEMFGAPLGVISGVAPRAHIIAYKGLGNLGGFGSDLAASIDQAVADGVDVINYSVGGGPSLTGADDLAFLFAADAGVFVATSAGNSGPGAGTIGGPASVPWLTSVGANTQPRFFQGTAHLGDGTEISGASITLGAATASLVDAEDAGGDLCVPGTLDPALVTGKIVLCRRGAIGRAEKSHAVSLAGGTGMILYNNVDTDNLFTDTHSVPSIHVDWTPGLQVKDYIDSAGGSATASITTGEIAEWEEAPSMTIFSSRGPNIVATDIIKPDITAPGMQILAGASPTPDPTAVQGELFQAIAGTSMSSPHVAGLFALLKQEHPDWTPAMAKSALMTTAYQGVLDNDRVSQATPFAMGAGHADPGSPVHKGSSFQPGLVYDADFFSYLGFLCDAEPSALSPSTCPFLESIGVPTDASDLNLASIAIGDLPGTQTVVRTVTSVAQEKGNRTYDVSVDAPDGYDVTVSPSTITLRSGQSATFEVTITNDGSGVIGAWSHGSLEWNDRTGNYRVYSPISVKGSLFSTAAQVDGTGTDGSTSFDVQFGYTGDYSAAPHGLVAPDVAAGDIAQDPDQAFDPADPVGVDLIPINVVGSAFVRIELIIPGDDDIDLFLLNSAGTIIASSTNGGTDETIELFLPADDAYVLAVHGWSVPNDPLPYAVSVWDVPLTSGGSLAVDSAPASAVVGSGTIDISWAGLTAGTRYLGAVSHSDAGGLIGLTLVSVES